MKLGSKKVITFKSKADFTDLRQKGRRVTPAPWLLIQWRKSNLPKIRWGCVLPKYVGSSVTRNRIRRWCREYMVALSQQKNNGCFLDISLVFRPWEKNFYKNLLHQEFRVVLTKGLLGYLETQNRHRQQKNNDE